MTTYRAGRPEGRVPRARGADPRVLARGRRLRAHRSRHAPTRPRWLFYEGPPTANGKPGHPPRRAAHVQGRLPALQDDDRPPRAAQGRLGLPRPAGRARGREGDRHHRQARHRGVRRSPSSTTAAASRSSATSASSSGSPSGSASGSTCPTRTGRCPPTYIESVWWSLKQLHERGLLRQDDKVTAYCPRCGTALSDAEVAQGYRARRGPERVRAVPDRRGADPRPRSARRSWCGRRRRGRCRRTTGAAVVGERPSTRCYERDGERLIVGRAAAPSACSVRAGPRSATLRRLDLVGRPLRAAVPERRGRAHGGRGDFVSMDDGTGIVHLAPAFGPDDLAVGRAQGWPVFEPVARRRHVHRRRRRRSCAGSFVKDADPAIVEDLRARGVLLDAGHLRARLPVLLALPHAAPLLRADVLVRPHHRGEGPAARGQRRASTGSPTTSSTAGTATGSRTTSTGRSRASGTGARRCRSGAARDGHETAIGSLDRARASSPAATCTDVDPHRPSIDEVTFPCPTCGDDRDARPRGDRHLVRLRRDAVRAVGLPPRARARRSRSSRRRSPPTSSPRRSTRRAGGSTR